MRASSRRSHHSSALAPGVKRPRMAKPSASSAASAAAMSSGVEPERRGQRFLVHRTRAFEPAAHDLDQRLLARPVRARHRPAGAAIARRPMRLARATSAWNCGSRSAAIQQRPIAPACVVARHAVLARKLGQPVAPARSAALRPRSGSRARPAHRAVRRHWPARARLRRAPARSPRDRAGRGRRRPPAPASAGPSPPACGAPPAARRRDRRRAAPTAPRARAATARSGRARRRGSRPTSMPREQPFQARRCPSPRSGSRAMVWRTSG